MNIPGVPKEGLKTVGQIVGTNDLLFQAGDDGSLLPLSWSQAIAQAHQLWTVRVDSLDSSVRSTCLWQLSAAETYPSSPQRTS